MLKRLFISTILSITPLVALAICEQGSKTVFSCLTGKGQLIQVCDLGKTIGYSYGKPQLTPEIVIRIPRRDASTYQWKGIGDLSYSVDIPKGDTIYSVYWSVDRFTDEHAIHAGVEVEINNEHVATVECVGEQHIVVDIEGIDLKPSE